MILSLCCPTCSLPYRLGDDRPTVSGFIEAVLGVTVRCQDCDFVPTGLQSHGCVDDQTLRASDAKVRVDKDDTFLVRGFRHTGERMRCDLMSWCPMTALSEGA